MPFGTYDGPDKPNKGKEGGACNRRSCQHEPATHYNHGMFEWYCEDCAIQIGFDPVNHRGWERDWKPRCGHDQFETRAQIDARNASPKSEPAQSNQPAALSNPKSPSPVDVQGEKRSIEDVLRDEMLTDTPDCDSSLHALIIDGFSSSGYQYTEAHEKADVAVARLAKALSVSLASPQPADAGWQDIASAPENVSILVFVPKYEHYGPGIIKAILVNMGTGRRWHSTCYHAGRDIGGNDWPTHWMPLPAAPQTGGEG